MHDYGILNKKDFQPRCFHTRNHNLQKLVNGEKVTKDKIVEEEKKSTIMHSRR